MQTLRPPVVSIQAGFTLLEARHGAFLIGQPDQISSQGISRYRRRAGSNRGTLARKPWYARRTRQTSPPVFPLVDRSLGAGLGGLLLHVQALDGGGVLLGDDLAPDLEGGGDLLGVEGEVSRQHGPALDALGVG